MSKLSISPRIKKFKDPDEAQAYLAFLYEEQVTLLQDSFRAFAEGKAATTAKKIKAYYPFIRITAQGSSRADNRLSYGFVSRPGTYETTVTRPDIYDFYLKEQIRLLILNHECTVEIGLSDTPIPLHFALGDDFHLEQDLDEMQIAMLPQIFEMPDLSLMDDEVANSTYVAKEAKPRPLSMFTAPRVDLSLMRLRHYTGTSADHFQNYVIFTNYQFYIDEFIKLCREMMEEAQDPALREQRSAYNAFVEPGNRVSVNKNLDDPNTEPKAGIALSRMPQMPAYHLKRQDGDGITMVNIGVGPSNAKTITDHIAVLRPHAWLMLGHCAGLRNSQRLGDYVLAHAYLRHDNVLDRDLPPSIPIPALAEIQQALEGAVGEIVGLEGYERKRVMRTGTVATVDDRNWELRPSVRNNVRLSQARAIALDMESGTIAANGYRFRVPYGTLLCVSDKPLHGQPKLPGMADSFYRERVEQHLQIGLKTMARLREIGPAKLHSRKLRSFNEPAFQ